MFIVFFSIYLSKKLMSWNFQQKRTAFPRFYFIGDDDLLEILGQSTNPQVIQSHMKKLFQGINRVTFSSTGETITSMVSSEGETVALSKPVRIVPQVETWLQQLSDEMRRTLKDLSGQAVADGQISLAKYPSQVLCLAEEVKFSAAVENVSERERYPSINIKGRTCIVQNEGWAEFRHFLLENLHLACNLTL